MMDTETIMVIDDSPVVRRVLSLTLESAGFDVLTAENGVVALDLIEDEAVHLIFCDIHMPVMNGIDFLKALRCRFSKEDLPIVMLTASGEQDAHAEAALQGANSILTKPASSHLVISTANSFLQRQAGLIE